MEKSSGPLASALVIFFPAVLDLIPGLDSPDVWYGHPARTGGPLSLGGRVRPEPRERGGPDRRRPGSRTRM